MKLGLVLEGGASRTYFSVGAMDALMEENIFADYVIGASAGIANGVSYVSRQKERSLEIGMKYFPDKRYMGPRHLLNRSNKSYYNIQFVFDDMPNVHLPFDYDTYQKYSKNVYAAVTNLNTGKTEYINIPGDDKSWAVLIATCALPILFQPVKIGNNLYMDGGITDSVPIEKALSDGCTKNLVILTREKNYIKKEEPALKLAAFKYRKYPLFTQALKARTENYNQSHRRLLELEKEGKAFIIAPQNTAGWHRTESDPRKLKKMYDDGFRFVKENLNQIKAYAT
jgi:predicted patatin/cPLA2 family phospholipase